MPTEATGRSILTYLVACASWTIAAGVVAVGAAWAVWHRDLGAMFPVLLCAQALFWLGLACFWMAPLLRRRRS